MKSILYGGQQSFMCETKSHGYKKIFQEQFIDFSLW